MPTPISDNQPSFTRGWSNTNVTTDCYINGFDLASLDQHDALRFDRTLSQYMTAPNHSSYGAFSAFTFSVWVRPTRTHDSNYMGIVLKQQYMLTFFDRVVETFWMQARIGGGMRSINTSAYTVGRWYKLCMTYNGIDFKGYLNGVLQGTVNVPGQTLNPSSDPWYTAFFPQEFNNFTTMDVSKTKFLDYALTPSEVAADFHPAFRVKCKPAYICAPVTFVAEVPIKRTYIHSPFSTTNPGFISSSLGLCIPNDAVHDYDQRAYITAGGEGSESWDNRIEVDHKTYTSWDQVVIIRGNQDRINEVQTADIVYPITRNARRKVRYVTSYDPLVGRSNHDCMIHTHFQAPTSSKLCHITANTIRTGVRFAYLHGFFTSITGSKPCYVVNNSVTPSKSAYIEGITVLKFKVSQSCYLHGFVDTATDTQPIYLKGLGVARPEQRSFVVAATPQRSARMAFIMSVMVPVITGRNAYLHGGQPVPKIKPLYIRGHGVISGSKAAYINAPPVSVGSKGCFINCQNPRRDWHNAFTKGWQSATGNKNCYLKAEVNIVGGHNAFLGGRVNMPSFHRLYLNAEAPVPATSEKWCFIPNSGPVTTHAVYIVGYPLATKLVYIKSIGNLRKEKSVFLAA